jgi:hypothetical protein
MHRHNSGFLVQRFRLLGLFGIGVIWSLIFTANILASPTATWTTPWNVTLGLETAVGSASNMRAFGASSTADGQIGNTGSAGEALSGTGALAKSTSLVFFDFFGEQFASSEASTEVDFSRSFSLKDSAGGWSLSLTGLLNGDLVAGNRYAGPSASVSARAQIGAPSQGFFLSDSVSPSPGIDPDEETTFAPGSFEGFFRDGIYTVTGALSTSAFVGNNTPSEPGFGLANFFDSNPSSGFSVRLNASPVPETINLVGAFAVFGFCGYIWFRRSRALRYG